MFLKIFLESSVYSLEEIKIYSHNILLPALLESKAFQLDIYFLEAT